MKSVVIGLSGRIGSGKTSVSSEMAKVLGWHRVSFGEYVRLVAQERGLPESRETLQDLGEELLVEDAVQFCKAVLAQANWNVGQPLIIEGVRHTKVVNILRQLVAPMSFLLVHIKVDDALQESRLRARGEPGLEKIQQIESHSTEKEVSSGLQNIADLLIDGRLSADKIALQICDAIQ